MNRFPSVATLLWLAVVPACSAEPPGPIAREIEVQKVELPIEGLAPAENGATLVAAWKLQSDDPDFGAFSGMAWDPQSGRLLAINDRGAWWATFLQRDEAGRLQSLAGSQIGVLLDAEGRDLEKKDDADAEGLAWLDASEAGPGGILVSFERDHRVDLYRSFGGLPAGAAQTLSRDFSGLKPNSGLEGLASMADGRVVGLVEEKPKKGSTRGWISDVGRRSWQPFRLRASWGHRPTGIDRAPGGGLLLLERMASPLTGIAAKVSWFPDPAGVAEGTVPSRHLFTVQSPLPVDNFEAIAANSDGNGGVHVLLLSDDNFNDWQRTLLLQFHCPERCYLSASPDANDSSDGNRSTR